MTKIILVGYMGVGKTTIGKLLSKQLNIPFFDLDHLIEREVNSTITEIFTNKGEIWFRKKEHEVLHNFLNNYDSFVLSLGGGTPCYANNHKVLQQDEIKSIYLKAKVSTLVNRLKPDAVKRPLIMANLNDLHNYIGPHVLERSYYYNFSKLKIKVDDLSVDEIVLNINELLCFK